MPFFDIITEASTIEHIGSDWDRSFIPEMCRILKNNGRIILTFPYGKEKGRVGNSRVYNDEMISLA